MKRVLPLLGLLLLTLTVLAQYGPGGDEGQGIELRIYARLLTEGSCEQVTATGFRCKVPAGVQGRLELEAWVYPPTEAVRLTAISLPPWASFSSAQGTGQAFAVCTFTPPKSATRRTYTLTFAVEYPSGLPYAQLTVILEVGRETEALPPTEPVYETDPQGNFTAPVRELPGTYVSGRVVCGGRPAAGIPIRVRLIPREGRESIRTLSDIGAVEVSSPGRGAITIPRDKLRFLSSMDIAGHVRRTIQVGTVCPISSAVYPPGTATPLPVIRISPGTSASGTTGPGGAFTLPMPGKPGEEITGRLVDCSSGKALPGLPLTVTPVYEGGKLVGFELTSTAFAPVTVRRFTSFGFSFFGKKGYHLGNVAVSTKSKEDLEWALEPIRGGDLSDLPPEVRRVYRDSPYDPAETALALGRYLAGRCFRVEVSRGELTVDADGERRTVPWALLAVYIGDKVYLVEATQVGDTRTGSPRIVGLLRGAGRARLLASWTVVDPDYDEEVRVTGYRESERVSLDEFAESGE